MKEINHLPVQTKAQAELLLERYRKLVPWICERLTELELEEKELLEEIQSMQRLIDSDEKGAQ